MCPHLTLKIKKYILKIIYYQFQRYSRMYPLFKEVMLQFRLGSQRIHLYILIPLIGQLPKRVLQIIQLAVLMIYSKKHLQNSVIISQTMALIYLFQIQIQRRQLDQDIYQENKQREEFDEPTITRKIKSFDKDIRNLQSQINHQKPILTELRREVPNLEQISIVLNPPS